MRLLSNRKVQLVLNGGFGLVLLGVAFFSVRHFVGAGWPIHHADPLLVVLRGSPLPRAPYAFKAWGWQRLFHVSERPTADALAFAGGAACVGGIALPGRVDDAVRIAVVKRYPGTKTSIGTLGLSLIVLGHARQRGAHADGVGRRGRLDPLDDSRRLRPRRRRRSRRSRGRRLPASHRRFPFVQRWRFGPLARRAHALHEGGVGGLAPHLGLVDSPRRRRLPAPQRALDARLVRARARVPRRLRCLGGLPIAPAGAATQAGAGAAILVLGGFGTADAVAFSVAAQALVIVTGAAVMLLIGSWQLALRLRASRARAAAAAAAAA